MVEFSDASTQLSSAALNEGTGSHDNKGNPYLGIEFVSLNTETVCSVTSEAWGTPLNVAKHPVGRRKTYLQTKLKLSMHQLDKYADSDGEDVSNSNKKTKTKIIMIWIL